jgi:hypothetical protein
MKSLLRPGESTLIAVGPAPKQLRIHAFRAVSDKEACMRFAEGHKNVLLNHGVKSVVTAREQWMSDPEVWVVLVDSPDGSKTYGGARIHRSTASNRLPIQEAIGYLDSGIDDFIKRNRRDGIGEICGLWNSVEVAGMGVGSVYLIRAGLSIVQQLGINKMFALCSPYTYRMAASFGFFQLQELGDKGKFNYPTDRLIATVTYQEDTLHMPGANEEQKNFILDLRSQPFQRRIETARNGSLVEVEYKLHIEDVG